VLVLGLGFAGVLVGCGPAAPPPVSEEESKAIAKNMRKAHEDLKAMVKTSSGDHPDMKRAHRELQGLK
jgi:hypothetical protein